MARVCYLLRAACVALSFVVAMPAGAQTSNTANSPPERQTPAVGPRMDPGTMTIFGRRRSGQDSSRVRMDPNIGSSCAFMQDYNPEMDAVVEGYLDDFRVRREESDDNFSDTSPMGNARSGQRSSLPGMNGELGEDGRRSVCNPSDRSFAAGRNTIARRDKSLRDAYAAFDAGDYPKALDLFEKSYVKMGYDSAGLMLGKMYLIGMGTEPDSEKAVMWLTKVAEARFGPADVQGFDEEDPGYMTPRSDAAMLLGRIYMTGWGTKRDAQKARKWYLKADAFGFIPGTYTVGRIHEYGYGGEKSVPKAVDYYKKAGIAGYAPAQYAIGTILYAGDEGVPADPKVAAEWFMHAAKRGHPDALYEIGRMYDLGDVLPANPEKAIVYYKEAALKDQPQAQNALGLYFYNGEIVQKDLTMARRWFLLAAEQGEPDAMFNLAVMMMKGEGGEVDRGTAYALFSLAEQSGLEKAGPVARSLLAKLTPEEKAKADSLLNPPAA